MTGVALSFVEYDAPSTIRVSKVANVTQAPPRGFPQSEFEARTGRAQRLMAAQDLGFLLLTTEPEVRYFSGFLTQFWESPTRPLVPGRAA